MKISSITEQQIPGLKIINFDRFMDQRGFFNETFRASDFINNELKVFLPNGIMQSNESFSHKNVLRGLHFQWEPSMGKLVRTIAGHMVDLVLDLRQGSPTQGKIMAFDMPAKSTNTFSSWIWVPEGCAHGNYFLEDSYIEYFCSGSYNGECEAGISPFAKDIDWSICDSSLKNKFNELKDSFIVTPKDINGLSVNNWLLKPEAIIFTI
jgi:dTDP-4-dehydrorhamnose 3,5-epimerase